MHNKMGNLIAIAKKNSGMTAKELGERLGVSRNTIGSYESGRSLPPVELLARFARITGADFLELLSALLEAHGERADLSEAAPGLASGRALALSGNADGHVTRELRPAYSTSNHVSVADAIERVRTATQAVVAACEAAGYTPEVAWTTALQELLFTGDLTPAGARRVVELLRGLSSG